MTSVPFAVPDASSRVGRAELVRLWVGAAAVASLATATIFDASVGLNWLLCVALAGAVLLAASYCEGTMAHVAPPVGLGWLVATGMVVTANEVLQAFSVIAVLLLLAVAIARSHPERHARAPLLTVAVLPVIVFAECIAQAVRRALDTASALTGQRAMPVLRGVAIALPITGLFALLLSSADPTMASWRESVEQMFSSWDFVPRTMFFAFVLVMSLGALGYAASVSTDKVTAAPVAERKPFVQLGGAERLIVLGTIAGLFTLFLTLQLRYLFGDVASILGSGMTYAEWAQRGFAELTVVATLCGGVMLWLALNAPAGEQRRHILALELIVIGETQVLLQSAFRRVLLYEEAYGYTTSRVWAQAYMIVVAASLLLLAGELVRSPEARRLLARAGALGVMALVALSMWNHEAWIVRQNMERYAVSQKLDMRYLACDLSANAVPELLRLTSRADLPMAAQARTAVAERFAGRMNDSWYEWNAGRARARGAIESQNIIAAWPEPSTGVCHRKW